MCRKVIEAEIRLGFDDHAGGSVVDQNAAEQRGCEFNRGPLEEVQAEPLGSAQQTRKCKEFVSGVQCTLEH